MYIGPRKIAQTRINGLKTLFRPLKERIFYAPNSNKAMDAT